MSDRGFIEDASITGRKQIELYPYNIESAQGFFMEYSADIVYIETEEPPNGNDSRFKWESVFIPYKIVDGLLIPYHVWIRFKIGRQGNWYAPVKLIYGRDGAKGDKGDKGNTGERGVAGINGERGDNGYNGSDGVNGINGTSAPLELVQYSANGSTWSNIPLNPTMYLRFSNDNAVTWGNPVAITANNLDEYVPYIGATTNVLLGNHNLSSKNLQVLKDNFLYFSLNAGTDTVGDKKIDKNGNVWICDTSAVTPGIGNGDWYRDNRPEALTNYLGNWNATDNTPLIEGGIGNAGDWYIVSVSGTTLIDGIAEWDATDYIWFSGDTNTWQRISNVGGVTVPYGYIGIIQINKNGVFYGDPELYWDFTGKRLAVGNVTKTEKLNVAGTAKLAGLAGTGDRSVVVSSTGVLKVGAVIGTISKEFYFSMAGDEVTTILEVPFNVTSVVLGNASALLYSIDNGVNWVTYTVPVTLPVGQIRFKVLAWTTGYDGSVIIKGN